jgi:hypothetical protein
VAKLALIKKMYKRYRPNFTNTPPAARDEQNLRSVRVNGRELRSILAEVAATGLLMPLLSVLNGRTAERDEVLYILRSFVDCISAGRPPPTELLQYLSRAFAGYLNKSHRTLDEAFMVLRKRRGNPGVDHEKDQSFDIATAILKKRFRDGLRHQEALEEAATEFGCGTTKAGKAWKEHRQLALMTLRTLSLASGNRLTQADLARAQSIVAGTTKRAARDR